ncbi:MAG: hypothetical protein ACPGYK_00765 [Flavobacteriales bacterium]
MKKKNNASLIPIFADAWRSDRPSVQANVARPDSGTSKPLLETASPSKTSTAPSKVEETLTTETPIVTKKIKVGGLRNGQIEISEPMTLKAPVRPKTKAEIAADWDAMNDPVSEEQVVESWNAFGVQKEKAEQFNLAATLQNRKPTLDGQTVVFHVVNELQEAQLAEIRAELLAHLRQKTRNGGLELKVVLEEVVDEHMPQQFMSDKERYDAMVGRHPLLEELRKRLDLDLS